MSFSLRSDDVFDYIGYSEDIQIEYLCDVCKKPLLDAQMATPCGHTFCGKCVHRLKETSRPVPCPLCRQIVQEFCRNIFVRQLLTTVQGECLFCKEKLQLDTAKQHSEKCLEIDVVCLQCNQTVKRRTQPVHENACPMREITCGCGEKCKQADLEKHRDSYCSFQKINCPLNCGHLIERYLLPSHTLQCPGVVQYCPIKGCREAVRKGNVKQHVETNLTRHFSLLKEERNNILWRGHGGARFEIQHRKNGEVGTFKWSVHPNPSQLACSPFFEKWNRRWRLFFAKKGDNLEYGLEYVQGVSPIHLALSFIIECNDSSCHVRNISVVNIKEGETTQDVRKTGIPRSIIVRMDQLEPVYL